MPNDSPCLWTAGVVTQTEVIQEFGSVAAKICIKLLAVKTEHTELIHLFLDLARLSLARGCHYLWSRLWIKLLKSPGNQRKKREAHNCSTCLRIIISLWHQSHLHVYEPSVNKDCKQLICRTSNGANLPKWKQNEVQIASHRQTPRFIWRCL